MKNISKYSKMPLQTISRKVWSSFIDGLLLLVLGVLLTLTLGFAVLKNNDTFIKYNDQCFDNISEMYRIQDESKLQILHENSDRKVLSPADYFDLYIYKQIKLSYINFTDDFKSAGITLEVNEDDYSKLLNDELAYYFVNYKVTNNINIEMFDNKEPLDFFKEDILFKNINKEYYVDRTDDLPIIKSDIAIKLYKHYSDIEKNTDLYYEFSDAVLEIRNIGLNDLKKYEVFDNYFILYNEAYDIMSKYENIVLVISFSIAFALLIFIPSIFIKGSVTIGKLLTRTREIHKDDFEIGRLRIIVRSLLSYLIYIFIVAFISLFSFGFENLKHILFSIGSIDISFLILLIMSFVFMIMNFIVIVLTPTHRSLVDILTNTKQLDTTTFI